MAEQKIGHPRPIPVRDITYLRTPKYLNRFANKIRMDMKKLARRYIGREVKLFAPNLNLDRCPVCIDELTGAVLISDCKTCNGSGRVKKDGTSGLEYRGQFWVYVDFTQSMNITGEMGNAELKNVAKDRFVVFDAPVIQDHNLLIVLDTKEVYKVVDEEPFFITIGGNIIAQVVSCAYLTEGSREYRLINWP